MSWRGGVVFGDFFGDVEGSGGDVLGRFDDGAVEVCVDDVDSPAVFGCGDGLVQVVGVDLGVFCFDVLVFPRPDGDVDAFDADCAVVFVGGYFGGCVVYLSYEFVSDGVVGVVAGFFPDGEVAVSFVFYVVSVCGADEVFDGVLADGDLFGCRVFGGGVIEGVFGVALGVDAGWDCVGDFSRDFYFVFVDAFVVGFGFGRDVHVVW